MKDVTFNLSALKHGKYIVFDTETTHLQPHPIYGRLIEIAGIKVNNGEVVETFSELIYPDMQVSAKTTELTHITNEMLKGKPKDREILIKFDKFLEKDYILVAHNAPFDDNYITYHGNLLGINFNNRNVIDTLTLTQLLIPNEDKVKGFYKLENLAKMLGLSTVEHHRAENDVIVCKDLLFKLFDEYLPNEMNNPKFYNQDLSFENEATYKLKITSCRLWEKEIEGRNFCRLYVDFNFNDKDTVTAYYDFVTCKWGYKDLKVSMWDFNFNYLVNELSKKTGTMDCMASPHNFRGVYKW